MLIGCSCVIRPQFLQHLLGFSEGPSPGNRAQGSDGLHSCEHLRKGSGGKSGSQLFFTPWDWAELHSSQPSCTPPALEMPPQARKLALLQHCELPAVFRDVSLLVF